MFHVNHMKSTTDYLTDVLFPELCFRKSIWMNAIR